MESRSKRLTVDEDDDNTFGRLPRPILADILALLPDAADVARARVASADLNAAAADLPNLRLACSARRYADSRRPAAASRATPFKPLAARLICACPLLDSVSLSFEDPFPEVGGTREEADLDDLWLTSPDWLGQWLPAVSPRLVSLSIADFWPQSRWRRSDVLGVVSSCCDNLLSLELKNAWLSVKGLNVFPKLTSLTLEFIRLKDEKLAKLNECFPSLQTLNLYSVVGVDKPEIHFKQLKTCRLTTAKDLMSLKIHAPNLTALMLSRIKPGALFIKSPMLSTLQYLAVQPRELELEELNNLESLELDCNSRCIWNFLRSFQSGISVKNLTLDAPQRITSGLRLLRIEQLMCEFPDLESLEIGPWVWLELQKNLKCAINPVPPPGWLKLKRLRVKIVLENVDGACALLSCIVNNTCSSSIDDVLVAVERSSCLKSDFIAKFNHRTASRLAWRFADWE